ncbi:MAG: hypothetical protein R3F11_16185 [Verrucomicrobiales bacterium]
MKNWRASRWSRSRWRIAPGGSAGVKSTAACSSRSAFATAPATAERTWSSCPA